MATRTTEKLICDRCGAVIREKSSIYKPEWQLKVERWSSVGFATARYELAKERVYDLCKECTLELEEFIMEKGAKPGAGRTKD